MEDHEDEFNAFTQGCWIRIISDIEKEVEILRKRQTLPRENLIGHDNQKDPNYTDYSSATFVKQGLPVSLYDLPDDEAGVFIDMHDGSIDHWYDGRKEVISDNLPRVPGQPLDNGMLEGQLWYTNRGKIAANLESRYQSLIKQYECEGITDSTPFLTWNEGSFRYINSDIVGIRVNADNLRSIKRAFDIQQKFNLHVPFYAYDSDTGSVQQVQEEALRKTGYLNYESSDSEDLLAGINAWGDAYSDAYGDDQSKQQTLPTSSSSGEEEGDDDSLVITIHLGKN